jgi:hypothetical protein
MATIRKRPLPSSLVRWQVDFTDQAGKRRSKLFPRRRANEIIIFRQWLAAVSCDT